MNYYRLAHQNGHEEASCDYAFMLISGQGVRQDIREGIRIYKQAAINQGNATAMFNLGVIYAGQSACIRGKVPRDMNEAIEYFQKSADKGCPQAMTELGKLLRKGDYCAVNLERARAYFKEVALNEKLAEIEDCKKYHRDAQFLFGMMMVNGDGGRKDVTSGYLMVKKAAEAGHKAAIKNFGKLSCDPPEDMDLGRLDKRRAYQLLQQLPEDDVVDDLLSRL